MIEQNTIDEIKLKANVVDVVGSYIKLKKNGANMVGTCPFHDEKSPSFTVSPAKQIYKCFGCGKSGDSITFVMEHERKSYIEALQILADKYHVQIQLTNSSKKYEKPLPRIEKLEKITIDYFETYRNISNNTLLRFRVTDSMEWMPKAKKEVLAINFNYYDEAELVNIKYRAKDKDFKLHKDARLIMYNLNAIKGQEWAIICEGEIEALTFHECGLYNVASVPNGAGAGKLNLEYLDNSWEHFSGIGKIYLATDGDFAGNGLRDELARRLGYERCFKVTYPTDLVVKDLKTGEMRACKDANEVLCNFGKEAVKRLIEDAVQWPIEGILTCEDMQDEILRFWEDGFPVGLEMGIPGFDNLLKFQDGQYTTVTGAPGSGKSEFLDYILAQATKRHGIRTGIVSFENQPSSIHATKLMQKLAGKSFAHRYNPANRMSQDDFERTLLMANEHYFFLNINENEPTIDGILDKLMELVKRKGIKFWVIDPWNYVEQNRPAGITETEYVSQCLTKIKRFVAMSGTHGFLIAHPTKLKKENGKYEVPTLYTISGSAHFYNKTDNGICVHIDETVLVYVQKVRFDWNGEKGFCEFFFNKETRQYQPLDTGNTGSSKFSNLPPPLKSNDNHGITEDELF